MPALPRKHLRMPELGFRALRTNVLNSGKSKPEAVPSKATALPAAVDAAGRISQRAQIRPRPSQPATPDRSSPPPAAQSSATVLAAKAPASAPVQSIQQRRNPSNAVAPPASPPAVTQPIANKQKPAPTVQPKAGPRPSQAIGCQQGIVTSHACTQGIVPRSAKHAACATAVTGDARAAPYCVPFEGSGRCTAAQCSSSSDCTEGECVDGMCTRGSPLIRARATASTQHTVKGTGPLMIAAVAITLLVAFYELYNVGTACGPMATPMLQ